MATSYGPKYPGNKDGLIYCFDPKNRDCWSGGTTAYNLPDLDPSITGSSSNLGPTELGRTNHKRRICII